MKWGRVGAGRGKEVKTDKKEVSAKTNLQDHPQKASMLQDEFVGGAQLIASVVVHIKEVQALTGTSPLAQQEHTPFLVWSHIAAELVGKALELFNFRPQKNCSRDCALYVQLNNVDG